jgi:MSHA biogenesis protein MshG
MPKFAFSAKDAQGVLSSGVREASSAGELAKELAATGVIPLLIKPEAEAAKVLAPTTSKLNRKVKLDELIIFSHQMASLTRAGISVVRAIRGLSESQKNERFAAVLNDIASQLESGTNVATSLRRYPKVFSELFASVIHVGENTGRLDVAFRQIAGYLETERETRRRVKAATRYPSFVIAAMGGGVLVLNIFVIPAFAGVFAKFKAELPWQTKAIMAVSDFFVNFWPMLLVIAVCSVFGLRQYLNTPTGRYNWDRLKLKLPLLGDIFNRINLARFCQTFAMVSKSGLPITQGLSVISRAIGNEYQAQKVAEMREGIERGSGVYQTARETNMFSPVVLQMISVGEETGNMDELMEQAAIFYEEEVDYDLKTLTEAIEPILIIGIAGMVLIMALGVFLPLWDLSSVALK